MAVRCPQCQCDVRLSVVAPELLALLEEIVQERGWNRLDRAVMHKALRLIAKAKGEDP